MVSTPDSSRGDVELPEKASDGGITFSFTLTLNKGLNIVSLPLRPQEPFTARSLMEFVSATVIIGASDEGKYVPFNEGMPGEGFPIEGARGYIVNTPGAGTVTFTGEPWSNAPKMEVGESARAPSFNPSLWAFAVDGLLEGKAGIRHAVSLRVTVQNLRTGDRITDRIAGSGRFALAFVDLSRRPVVQVGDVLRLTLADAASGTPIGRIDRVITSDNMRKAYLTVNVEFADLAPMATRLLQNYPNPFNPETWLPYQLADDANVTIRVYSAKGQLVRTFDLGHKPAGFYTAKGKAARWDGRDQSREKVASGVYFYIIEAGDFTATRKMTVVE
jgi:hypothetical protein